jgi:hypothetical protein
MPRTGATDVVGMRNLAIGGVCILMASRGVSAIVKIGTFTSMEKRLLRLGTVVGMRRQCFRRTLPVWGMDGTERRSREVDAGFYQILAWSCVLRPVFMIIWCVGTRYGHVSSARASWTRRLTGRVLVRRSSRLRWPPSIDCAGQEPFQQILRGRHVRQCSARRRLVVQGCGRRYCRDTRSRFACRTCDVWSN